MTPCQLCGDKVVKTPKGQKDIRVGSRWPEWLVTRKKRNCKNVQELGHSVGDTVVRWRMSVYSNLLLLWFSVCVHMYVAWRFLHSPSIVLPHSSTPLVSWLYAQRLAVFMKDSWTEYPTVVSNEKKRYESILLPLSLSLFRVGSWPKPTLRVPCRPSFKSVSSFHPSSPRPLLFISTNRDSPWVEKQQVVCHPAEKREAKKNKSTRTPTHRGIESEKKVRGESPMFWLCQHAVTKKCKWALTADRLCVASGCPLCVVFVSFLFIHSLHALFSILDAVHISHSFHFSSHVHAVSDSPIIWFFCFAPTHGVELE